MIFYRPLNAVHETCYFKASRTSRDAVRRFSVVSCRCLPVACDLLQLVATGTKSFFRESILGSCKMPRCYMVKKQSNKYQSQGQRDSWDQNISSSSSGAPESPIEGCVAPLCYTSLNNRTGKWNNMSSTLSITSIINLSFIDVWIKEGQKVIW